MATFEATRNQRVQRQFEVLEIDLPVITGACTVGSSNGFGTPLTCDQVWTGEYETYKFTNEDAPILQGNYWRVIRSISENTTELKPGDGLSSRGSLSITLIDFDKQDPNPNAPGVTDTVKNQGNFLAKLSARQIFENKNVRLKLYRVEEDGTIDLVNGAETRHYVANAFALSSNNEWKLDCKDVLSLASLNEKSWPIATTSFLRFDIDDAVTSIPVDADTDYSTTFAVRIGDEFLEILSVTDNLLPTASLNVNTRGGNLFAPVSTVLLTQTEANDHSAGDEVFLCDLSDGETIDSFLTRVLVASDFDVSLIPAAEWAAEVQEWHSNDKINTLHSETESVNTVLNRVLTGFLMDLWFSTTENLAKLSAISVWKESTALLVEGKEINAYTIKKTPNESIRATRALIVYDKKDLASSDDASFYSKASQFSDNSLIGEQFFVKHKDKLFENNFLLGKDAADLLVQRYVSRFKFTPFTRSFTSDERFLTFKTGDVVDLSTTIDQGVDGLPSGNIRGQILKIKPRYSKDGRSYQVKAMTYEAAFSSGSEIILNSPLGSVNLFILAGAPSADIDLTFILDGTYSNGAIAIRAGGFSSGSKLIIILANGFDGQADGGTGGDSTGDGSAGGIVYDAQGVDTDIYFSGDTSAISTAYPVADGYIRAPGGGGGGGASFRVGLGQVLFGGGGGGGGAGRVAGLGGATITENPSSEAGQNGDIIGNGGLGGQLIDIGGDGGDWGVGGQNGQSIGGGGGGVFGFGAPAGSGIIDNGATVTLFGDTPARYINGNGSHP